MCPRPSESAAGQLGFPPVIFSRPLFFPPVIFASGLYVTPPRSFAAAPQKGGKAPRARARAGVRAEIPREFCVFVNLLGLQFI